MRISEKPERMNDDINLLISEAKIRRDMTDEDVGRAVCLKKTSLRNSRHNRTLSNLPFWKVAMIAKLAGYDIILTKKGEKE